MLKHIAGEPTGSLLKPGDPGYQEAYKLTSNLEKNIKIITEIFGLSDDLMVRGLKIGRGKKHVRAAVIYLDTLIDHTRLQQGLMHCLQTIEQLPPRGITTEWLINNALSD
ncbi:MAG: spore germination protein, partial [Thermacetogeniaceae bacterium]